MGLEGGEGWRDFSRYKTFDVLPARGDAVELVVARGKFINGLKVLTGADLDAKEEASEPEELTGDDVTSLQPPGPDGDEPGESWGYSKGTAAPRRVAPAPAPAPVARPPAPAPQRHPRGQGEAFVARVEGLKAALALFAGGVTEPTAEQALAVAGRFTDWLMTGRGAGPEEGGA